MTSPFSFRMSRCLKYLGAAHLISDPPVLEAAGSILMIEARHQTNGTGTAIPGMQGFDVAMWQSEVLAIAGSFISGCDTGIPSNMALTLTNTGTPSAGTLLTFSWSGMPSDTTELQRVCNHHRTGRNRKSWKEGVRLIWIRWSEDGLGKIEQIFKTFGQGYIRREVAHEEPLVLSMRAEYSGCRNAKYGHQDVVQ
ncbi:hypothetical protein JB92DRAFT_2904314 [Gautieria morchelliformis]|nr:hypothetical protein JB92DRAFT_2904314 [Gautieria morchelliformis]